VLSFVVRCVQLCYLCTHSGLWWIYGKEMYYQGSCTSWCKIQHHMSVTANTNAIFWKQWLLFRPFSYASAGAPKYFAQGLQIAKTVTANHNQKNNIKTKLNGCFW